MIAPVAATYVGYVGAKAVTPHDSNGNIFKGFFVTAAGNVTFVDSLGNTVVITALAANILIPISTKLILSTGTTATGIYGLL